jgi:hypothetical protein
MPSGPNYVAQQHGQLPGKAPLAKGRWLVTAFGDNKRMSVRDNAPDRDDDESAYDAVVGYS